MDDDPLIHAVKLVMSYNDQVSKYIISNLTCNNIDEVEEDKQNVKMSIINSGSNILSFYKKKNPNLVMHEIYRNKHVNDIERISWTRLQLSAHSLAVEKGCWNRLGRGSLPLEERLCPCGLVQTETHVIESCPLTLHLRNMYNITSVKDLLLGRTDYSTVCTVIHKILALY
ncbi:hypothetical protein E2C01_065283 [Portunus trituberculatus]|uniref:Reverse transcriptase zinc-binding domain-containing protein n=1 Tax=Portunus trituberculatus TaxID=210409 RepID=A0A5B7HM53_PORTR|nr:hypothetical protein [Portunus trituberculatus]